LDFPISGAHFSPFWLIGVGFVVGILGGFFGVGGSFLVAPMLYALGLPMNFVVGTDLAHIMGKSVVGARKHWKLGNVDWKLGLVMVGGTIVGVEVGAQLVETLKRQNRADLVLGGVFSVLLIGLSGFMTWESVSAIRKKRSAGGKSVGGGGSPQDRIHFTALIEKARALRLGPMVSFPISGVSRISIWPVIGVGLVGGFFSGLLGGGAGYVRMPSLVYILGVPTHVAVGTDLFEVVLSAGYGTVSHAWKGNVDIMIALVMHTGAAIGAQIGATATERFQGPKIRLAFVPLPIAGSALLIYELIHKGVIGS
jgi:uncharacterized protein